MFTEKVKERYNQKNSLINERFTKRYDERLSNEVMIKTTLDAMKRSPIVRQKVLRSIDAISQDQGDRGALSGYQNSQLANSRVKAFNFGTAQRHLDPRIIANMVAKE